jgi:hypothetical protein
MRLRRKSPLERMLDTVGDSLEAVTDVGARLPRVTSGTARKAGVIAASLAGLTAGSAGISSLRRRGERTRDGS